MQGPQAHAAGVLFPDDADVLQRSLLVGNLNPLVNPDQVQLLCIVELDKSSGCRLCLRALQSTRFPSAILAFWGPSQL